MLAPVFSPGDGVFITSRGISTVCLNPNPPIQVNYTLITANSPDCLNPETLSTPPPQLQYRFNGSLWMTVEPGEMQ